MTFYLFLSLMLHAVTSSAAEEWCYDIQAAKSTSSCKVPSKWSDIGAACGGKKQSPIDIVTKKAKFDSNLIAFTFEGYDKELELELSNNGHTAKLGISQDKETIQISGGGLSGTYIAAQLHFHWGSKEKSGSEHSLNGKKYPIELHIVHTKKEARSEPSGGSTTSVDYGVLGFFFKEGKSNDGYTNLVNGLSKIIYEGNITTVSKVKLQDLIPRDLKVFYRYEGSLTTPECDETVTWTVFAEPIELSKAQIDAFYGSLKYGDNLLQMVENFRPIQELNGRTITTSGVDAVLPHTRYLLISLFAFYFTVVS
ncbi:carbonic anhydrase 4 [Ranitomeya variabilis]|uniref:carbonic anhydrase 4 n=1 Tax=Ranitomeya variabilis TaxID=490064 RepID=UPI004056197F